MLWRVGRSGETVAETGSELAAFAECQAARKVSFKPGANLEISYEPQDGGHSWRVRSASQGKKSNCGRRRHYNRSPDGQSPTGHVEAPSAAAAPAQLFPNLFKLQKEKCTRGKIVKPCSCVLLSLFLSFQLSCTQEPFMILENSIAAFAFALSDPK